MKPTTKDLTSQTIGYWTVLNFDKYVDGRGAYWLCKCVCGKEKVRRANSLVGVGFVSSCGCRRGQLKDGLKKKDSDCYHIWSGIMKRTKGKDYKNAKNYSDRGITACDYWQKFENFLNDVGERPLDKSTIDRINNNEGYYCGHCEECLLLNREKNWRWASMLEQQNNRRDNVRIEFDGKIQTASQWSRERGISADIIISRHKKGVLPPEIFDKEILEDKITRLKNSWKIRKFSDEQVAEIKKDMQNGMTSGQIAKKFNCSDSTIYTLPNAIYFDYPKLEDAISYITEKFKKEKNIIDKKEKPDKLNP